MDTTRLRRLILAGETATVEFKLECHAFTGNDAHKAELAPFIAGWGWWRGKPETFLGNFQHPGIHNPAPFVAVGDSVDFIERLGLDNVSARGRELAQYGRNLLAQIPGIAPVTPAGRDFQCSMVYYNMPPIEDAARLRTVLDKHGLVVPGNVNRTGGWIRVSTHLYNTEADVDLLARGMSGHCGLHG